MAHGTPELPVLQEVEWNGFTEHAAAERSLFDEHLALRRYGRSEIRWSIWLRHVLEELRMREDWWHRICDYAMARWGVLGGRDRVEEKMWQCFYGDELWRRYKWARWMMDSGFGDDPSEWRATYDTHYRRGLRRCWANVQEFIDSSSDEEFNDECSIATDHTPTPSPGRRVLPQSPEESD